MNKQNIITALLTLFGMTAMAQTDSTSVKDDSVTWNQSLDGVTVKAHLSSAMFQQTNRLDSLKNMIVLAMASGYTSEVKPPDGCVSII